MTTLAMAIAGALTVVVIAAAVLGAYVCFTMNRVASCLQMVAQNQSILTTEILLLRDMVGTEDENMIALMNAEMDSPHGPH